MTDVGKVGRGGGGWDARRRSLLTRASDYLWQLFVSLRATCVVYEIFRGQPISQLGWDGSLPDSTLNPEAIPGPLETPSGFRSGQKACNCSGSWEPDPGQMDLEAKQEATTGLCFERHLSPLSGREYGLLCWLSTELNFPHSHACTHPHTHTHPSHWDDLDPRDPQSASLSQGSARLGI